MLRAEGKEVRGQMVAGEWVSDYSKRPGRSSIPLLRPGEVNNWSSHRHSDKIGADARKQEEMGAKEVSGTLRSRGTHYEVSPNESRKPCQRVFCRNNAKGVKST